MKSIEFSRDAFGFRLADVSWATALASRGLTRGEVAASWNLTRPDHVREVSRECVEAGSSVVVANTLHANRGWLRPREREELCLEWNRAGVRLAREACGDVASVLGSVGPTGRSLAAGEITLKWLRETYRLQIAALADSGVDAILVEGMSDLSEARLAVEVAKERSLPVIATMVFDTGPARDRTQFGTSIELAGIGLVASGADAVGISGGWSWPGLDALVRRLRAASDRPVWTRIQPMVPPAFPTARDTEAPVALEGEALEKAIEALVDAGVWFLAGGAGVGPEFIRSIRAAIPRIPSLRAAGERMAESPLAVS